MLHAQTLPAFYADKLALPPPSSGRSGHFAVFRLEDFAAETAPAATYGRKDFYKIMLGTGHATYHYADQHLLLEPGQHALVFANARVPYGWEVHSLPYCGYFCVFTEEFLLAHAHLRANDWAVFQPAGPAVFRLAPVQAASFGELFEKMLAEQASDFPYKDDLLFFYFMECVYGALRLAPPPEPHGTGGASRLAASFQALQARQYPIVSPAQRLELRTAQAFADRLAVHVNSLNRVLKAVTGKTTSQLLAERLVQEARALLRHTDWPIGQIGYCLGFEEQTHFTQFFRRYAGCTPSALRQV